MALIIDGYNLLNAVGIPSEEGSQGNLERARGALLNFLAKSLPRDQRKRTTVVFDAGQDAPRGLPCIVSNRDMTIHFASHYDDADTLIEELILADSAPRSLTVVSSDHRIQRAAHRRRARGVDSDHWYLEILRSRGQQDPTSPRLDKPQLPLSPQDVDYWLSRFQSETREDGSSELPNGPFPPGYGEDLLEENAREEND